MFGWGAKGHHIVGDIADAHLAPTAKAGVQTLLGTQTLADVTTWADEVRRDRPETYNWHFVDIPAEAAGYDAARDCKPTPKGDCVIAEIGRAEAILADTSKSNEDRAEALKWLVGLCRQEVLQRK